ncbi:MAG: ABC transporter permease, partial [Candidatus Methanomethylophilaceae archaeon]|nr:ABC transporter permease [Candidatus Methanomethylophilaceae archaeon]
MIAWDIIDESYRVAWGDLCYIKENLPETLLTGLVGPLLYLLAFGYGVGGSMGGGQDYIVFIVPGIIALTTLSATFSTVSMKILVQRLFYMSFDEMLLCPIHITSVVIGKTASGVIRATLSCIVIMIVGHLIAPSVV